MTSHDPTTLQSVEDAKHLPDTWVLDPDGYVCKHGKVTGRCGDLDTTPGDNISVSWTPAGIRLHHYRRVQFTWSVDGPDTGDRNTSPPVRPWDRDSPPTGPLWAVVDMWEVDSVSVLDTFPTGKYTILSYTEL